MISLEVKARCPSPAKVRAVLQTLRADFKGLDRQIDTYFIVPSGRLKLREGRIENALIYYQRDDRKGSKRCDSTLYPCPDPSSLKRVLKASLGVLVVVDKEREIYFIRNAKFHIDRVKGLGSFVEIEVFERPGKRSPEALRKECGVYQQLLGILKRDLVADSYSDQLLRRRG